MSAETQQRCSSGQAGIILPQPVTDKGIMESVTGFITDVVPQVSAGGFATDAKDAITWARFEETDNPDDLILVLGYGNGVQVWAVSSNGEAREALSWRRGPVRSLRLLLTPSSDVRDNFAHKRPVIALCDATGSGPTFSSLSFISLRVGDQVKIIKYKSPISDVQCSKQVVVVSFPEKLAILDPGSLEERRAILTCYPVSGPNPNPIALGSRWLAFADRRVSTSDLSCGGAESFSGHSVTATVLHAAKSFGKAMANSLTGQKTSGVSADMHPGVVSILDCRLLVTQEQSVEETVAHFVAHTEAIVAISFDPSGMLLLTADKQGYDFHVFRIQPHPCGSVSTAVHHLYVLHRGDTAAKVQDITWTPDSRWVAVSTLRGTTHVFAVTSYGGPVGVRTHLSPHVVNRLSRFHRSAGLLADGRNSPETVVHAPSAASPNPRFPPFPHPTILSVLAQIRQPNSVDTHRPTARTNSVDDTAVPIRLTARFGGPRSWVSAPKYPQKSEKRVVDSLYIMSCSGNLVEYELKPRAAAGVPREKVCDDTPLEVKVDAKAQWALLRAPHTELQQLPLSPTNPILPPMLPPEPSPLDDDEHWLSQVEIITHAGPHRRLWMGPQFCFKTFSLKDPEPVDVGVGPRSNPVNIPLGSSNQPVVPVLIESASCSSLEQSPRLHAGSEDSDSSGGPSDQLAECLADAMIENPVNSATSSTSQNFISL